MLVSDLRLVSSGGRRAAVAAGSRSPQHREIHRLPQERRGFPLLRASVQEEQHPRSGQTLPLPPAGETFKISGPNGH